MRFGWVWFVKRRGAYEFEGGLVDGPQSAWTSFQYDGGRGDVDSLTLYPSTESVCFLDECYASVGKPSREVKCTGETRYSASEDDYVHGEHEPNTWNPDIHVTSSSPTSSEAISSTTDSERDTQAASCR